MVYNAMKLFMEINPQLFDDCSHDYNEHQNNADKREQERKEKWDKLQQRADRMKESLAIKATPPTEDTDATQDKLETLNLHDESAMAAQPAAVSHSAHPISFLGNFWKRTLLICATLVTMLMHQS